MRWSAICSQAGYFEEKHLRINGSTSPQVTDRTPWAYGAFPSLVRGHDDDCFYNHSWRNNVVIAFGTLSFFLT